jgi:perosamine synthetase
MRIPLSKPDIGEREIEYVTRTLRSGNLSNGSLVNEFEEKFAAYAGTRYAIATNSGTSALHLCVRALDIGVSDEVITTSFSFVASANCLLYERAMPAFADIDPATLNIGSDHIREVIAREYIYDRAKNRHVNHWSGRVLKAILPMHVFGLPCDMAPILEIAREFNLMILEDACEALGAEYRGRRVGTFGEAAVFAFYPNKQMTTAEGGMIVTDSLEVATLCRSLRNQGRDEDTQWLRHVRLGYNYRLSELHCALGLAQLERIDELLLARERVARLYSQALSRIPGIELPHDPPGSRRSWFVYAIRLQGASGAERRDYLMVELRKRGIACQTYFPAIHQQPYFVEFADLMPRALPNTEWASACTLALPFFPTMTNEQVAEVCSAVAGTLAEAQPVTESVQRQYSEALRSAQ